MWLTANKRFVWHVCPRNPCLLWNLSYQKLEVPESGSTVYQLCIIASCPSLRCSCRKKLVACREAEGFATELWSPRLVTTVIVLSVVPCDCCKPMNSCRDWAFSLCGLEVGLPAFQLPMFAKCNALPKRDLFDMFVSGIHAFWSFCEI